MEPNEAIARVLLGESLHSIADAYREDLLTSLGLAPNEARPETFAKEARAFVTKLCRVLADRHEGDRRAYVALRAWVDGGAPEYDAWDALLSGFEFDGKQKLVDRGRVLFPGPLTAHWHP